MKGKPFRVTSALICVALLAAWAACGKMRTGQSVPRRNFVIIIADDMAWDDCGAFGNRGIRTPNIDRLAREGMRFEHAFVTASSCSPSRSSLITGRYPHSTDAEQLHWPLPAEQVTFVERLRVAGYWTAAVGKWHLGEAVKDRFDLVREASRASYQMQPGSLTMMARDDSGAAEWIPTLRERPRDRPFFLWLAAADPHRDYREGIIPQPHRPEDTVVPPYLPDAPAVRRELALYYDEIARLDDFVGKVLAELAHQSVTDNTLVLFLSDNGRPFPRAKTTLYDSGIRTPVIARWPAMIRAGTVAQGLVSTVDVAPTILELARVPSLATIQGRSFVSMLKDPEARIRDAVYAEKNWHDYEDRARAVRTERFKYIRNDYTDLALTPSADAWRSPTADEIRRLRADGKLKPEQAEIFRIPRPAEELYDTQADPHELRNLAGDPKYAETLERLRQKLAQWQKETNDRKPSARTPDEFDRETGKPLPGRAPTRPGKNRSLYQAGP